MIFAKLPLIAVSWLAASTLLLAQSIPENAGGWRRVADASTQAQVQTPAPSEAEPPAEEPTGPPNTGLPTQLTIKAGTFLTVRVDQELSSDYNQVGDAFSATLVQPIVVDGYVVAQRGQTLGGRIAEVDKGGRIKKVSRLGIELTTLSLVDGQQVPLQAQLISRKGADAVGRDAAAVATTTGMGALIGAAADGGVGAGIGAAAGAGAGLIGVLLTRGNPTVVDPETALTFRLEAPIAVSTERAPLAFRIVNPDDYQQAAQDRPAPRLREKRRPSLGYPYPYYYPYPYWGWGGWGWGPGYYGFGTTIFISRHHHSFHGHRRR